jgi:hypothetical protein
MPHDLTPAVAEARATLMAHIAHKPKNHDAFDLEAWHDRKAVLEADLNKAMGGAAASPPQALPSDVPRVTKAAPEKGPPARRYGPAPKDPQIRLDGFMKKFRESKGVVRSNAKQRIKALCRETGLKVPAELDAPIPTGATVHVEAAAKPGDDLVQAAMQKCEKAIAEMHSAPAGRWDLARDAALDLRSELRSICEQLGRPMPKLPPIPKSPAQVAPPPQMQEPTVPQREVRQRDARIQTLDGVRGQIRSIRAQTWSLLAELERLTPEQLLELEPDLGMLDEAAHITTRLAGRRAA